MIEQLIHQISHLVRELHEDRIQRSKEFEWHKSHSGLATKHDLDRLENKLMSKISEFLAAQQAFNSRQAEAVDAISESLTGLTGDIETLNQRIIDLQNSEGAITPEDQAVIDELQAKSEALATKAEALAVALKALDDQTPPAVPATEPTVSGEPNSQG